MRTARLNQIVILYHSFLKEHKNKKLSPELKLAHPVKLSHPGRVVPDPVTCLICIQKLHAVKYRGSNNLAQFLAPSLITERCGPKTAQIFVRSAGISFPHIDVDVLLLLCPPPQSASYPTSPQELVTTLLDTAFQLPLLEHQFTIVM